MWSCATKHVLRKKLKTPAWLIKFECHYSGYFSLYCFKSNTGACNNTRTYCIRLISESFFFSLGPITVCIDTDGGNFYLYKSGVYSADLCTQDYLTHVVLVVGYGTYKGKDYWLAKNSWGKSWGMEGYIMMSRNKDNQCGIATKASYPLV